MASYRLSAKIISRSDGKSSVAAAAYRSGTRLIDERTGEVHDYRARGGVTSTHILAPNNSPELLHDRQALWNAVEHAERRKDAQLSREIQLSLPRELSEAERERLVLDFAKKEFVDMGMIADIAIHKPEPNKGENEKNHHAHIMLGLREIASDGFAAKKNRDWNKKELLKSWREKWALCQNEALERAGHNARVTHLSLEAQGVVRIPQIHLGPAANQMMTRGEDHPRIQRLKETEKINTRLRRLEAVQEGRLRQMREAEREKKQLENSLRQNGLLKFWKTLTGQRQAELRRVEDVKAEHVTMQRERLRQQQEAAALKTRLDALKQQKAKEQREKQQAQKVIQTRVSNQGRKIANDQPQTLQRPPRPPDKPTKPFEATRPAKPAFDRHSGPAKPQGPQRPVRQASGPVRRQGGPEQEQ